MTTTKILTYENDFQEFLAERNAGHVCQIDSEMFYYWMEVLPPIFMGRETTLIDGTRRWASFGFAEGAERITAFWVVGNQFFAQYSQEVSRG